MKKRILFLINPISGIGKQKTVENLLEKDFDTEKGEYEIQYTQYRGHAHELAKAAIGKFNAVVAVGGDGTVNEVGSALINTKTALAIIPTGSGNGLARYLQIPLRINRAIQAINLMKLKTIDTLSVNGQVSLNVAGIGFDAFISHKFANIKERGPLAYMKLIPKEFANYKSQTYTITIEGERYKLPAFLLSFANSSQWGNNVHIAPQAKIDDGLIDVCIIKDFPKITAPALLISLLDQSLDQRPYDVITRAKNIVIECDEPMLGHLDGEPIQLGQKAEIEIKPLSLKVVVPPADFNKNILTDPLNSLKDLIPPLPHIPNLPHLPKGLLGNDNK
ncbi:diacylglycerol/lipid kinase family protein [Carboxylicivirga caseinilyticus]|uniref:diacylglycerol/lipid kinase family protein n=1 Tax=Carboxylicivirga caseinilyticus TaxID=3417572 RepID=UPI003D34BB70|nr:diacylglycerol kinase family lipid kinase [Marinilabiliaceae bacterium A049]